MNLIFVGVVRVYFSFFFFRFSRNDKWSNRTSFVFQTGKFIGLSIKGTMHFREVFLLGIPYSSRKYLQRFVVFLSSPFPVYFSYRIKVDVRVEKYAKSCWKKASFPVASVRKPSFLLSSRKRPSINYLLKPGKKPSLYLIFLFAR